MIENILTRKYSLIFDFNHLIVSSLERAKLINSCEIPLPNVFHFYVSSPPCFISSSLNVVYILCSLSARLLVHISRAFHASFFHLFRFGQQVTGPCRLSSFIRGQSSRTVPFKAEEPTGKQKQKDEEAQRHEDEHLDGEMKRMESISRFVEQTIDPCKLPGLKIQLSCQF